MQSSSEEMQFARELHERIRREFPEVRSLGGSTKPGMWHADPSPL